MASDRQRQSNKQYRRKSPVTGPSLPLAATKTVSALSANSDAYFPSSKKASIEFPHNSKEEGSGATVRSLAAITALLDSGTADASLVANLDRSNNPGPESATEVHSSVESETVWEKSINTKIQELVEQTRAFERERIEIEHLREHLRHSIEIAEERLAATSSNESMQRLSELESQLAYANTENAKLSELLHHARSEYHCLVEFIETESKNGYAANQNSQDDSDLQQELILEISQLKDQIQFLQNELSESHAVPQAVSTETAELRIQIEKLRSQLLDARNEAVESKLQNTDLSSSLAKYKDPLESQRGEALTWEQRKEALMRQLNAETQSEELCDPNKALEIEKIIQQTDVEIQSRNQEIQDLRSLLEQQAIAQNGMAIGVAAVAEMIESDAMIIAERLRLQEMQQDWETKQRQAEIEMSMERAKLARERLELQEKLRSFESEHPAATPEEKLATKERGRGRWLARLGLRDE